MARLGKKISHTIKKSRFSSAWVILSVLAMVLVNGCAGVSGIPGAESTPTADPLDLVSIIAEERSRAEEWAKILKSNWEKSTAEYKEGEALYIDGKASFDGWIEQLKLDIIAGRKPEASQYENSLKEAMEESRAFIEYVQDLERSSATPVVALEFYSLIRINIVEELVSAAIRIWEAYRAADAEKKQQIIDMLDELKWKSFQDI